MSLLKKHAKENNDTITLICPKCKHKWEHNNAHILVGTKYEVQCPNCPTKVWVVKVV